MILSSQSSINLIFLGLTSESCIKIFELNFDKNINSLSYSQLLDLKDIELFHNFIN